LVEKRPLPFKWELYVVGEINEGEHDGGYKTRRISEAKYRAFL
jgi:hypothetical protein